MKMKLPSRESGPARRPRPVAKALLSPGLLFIAATLLVSPAHASMFKGEALDTAADVLAWVVLIVAPIIGIGLFWMVHILPEKIAEKKKHPQAKAIQVLCLLSLVFGGLLWPFAFLWAYSKPVMYKLAYGTDTVEPEHGKSDKPAEGQTDADQLKRLRAQVAELETRLAGKPAAEGEKA